jgi:CO/xanthine dehydrogenase FAD-binding subunit
MSHVRFLKPTSLSQACQMLADEPNSMALAGGTDLIVKVRNGLFPDLQVYVDLTSLPLNKIVEENGKLKIGSGCTMTEITESPLIRKYFPTLAKAARTVGALQIRNSATLGGNTANASPAGDTIPALYSLEAQIQLHGPNGTREIAIDSFFTGPGRSVMEKGEIIENFIIPIRETKGEFLKLGERKAHAISKINLAITTWNENDKTRCRIAMGSVAPTVIRVTEAEKFIEASGFPQSEADLQKLAQMAENAATPISDVRSSQAYRKKMAGVLLTRALKGI